MLFNDRPNMSLLMLLLNYMLLCLLDIIILKPRVQTIWSTLPFFVSFNVYRSLLGPLILHFISLVTMLLGLLCELLR